MAPAPRLTGDRLANFGVDLSLVEAGASKEALFAAYPAIREYQQDQVDRARQDGVLWSVTGRPLRARWEKGRPDPLHGRGELRRPGERRRRAPGRDGQRPAGAARLDDPDRPRRARPGGREDRAEEAAAFLPASMGAAFSELFPGAPLNGLVEARVAQCWAHAK
jgi:hypothetical protein